MIKGEYLKELKERAKQSRVYNKHQLMGLEIALLLGDEQHKTLYIKLAREYNVDRLLELAKSVAEKKDVQNKGAYFMVCFKPHRKEWRVLSSS